MHNFKIFVDNYKRKYMITYVNIYQHFCIFLQEFKLI